MGVKYFDCRKVAKIFYKLIAAGKPTDLSVGVRQNPDFKRDSDLGRRNNQNFVQISFGDFRQILASLCEQEGILYVEQEESYTSKSSFLDNDPLPKFDVEHPYIKKFSGKRVLRGLYCSADGTCVNADINGAANIIRKSSQNFRMEGLRSGLLASPQRIRVS